MLTAVTTAAGEVARAIATAAGGWLTVGQAARRLQRSESGLRAAVAAGKIPGRQLYPGGRWDIPRAWVAAQVARVAPIRRAK